MEIGHRPDIQGIRAIAVLLVVTYHSGLIFKGGFIGVDVFFVISGYVIMKSLLREFSRSSTISVRNFFSRRVHRLLPASTLVVVFTLVGSLFVFSPFGEQQQIATTSLSSLIFSTNLYFIFQNSYSALVNNPLRHMWSLGVEEQFYIYLIFVIALLIRLQTIKTNFRKKLMSFVLIASVISFTFNIVLSNGIRILPLPTRIAFFSPFTRFWELQLGVLIAFLPNFSIQTKRLRYLGDSLTALGLLLIVWSGLSFNSFMQFPGLFALIPTAGTVLLVLFSPHSTFVGKCISIKPLQFIGDLSYSWYLWHWPLIVFCQVLFPGNHLSVLIAGFGSIFPAFLTFRFIENRYRITSTRQNSRPIKIAATALGLQLASAIGLLICSLFTFGLSKPIPQGATGSWAYKAGCQMTKTPFPAQKCSSLVGQSQGTILLLGDSQAGSLSDGVLKAAEALNLDFVVWYNDGCPIFPRPTEERFDCLDYQNSIPTIVSVVKPDILVVANKASLYGMGGAQGGGLSIRNEDGSIPDTYSETIEMWGKGINKVFQTNPYRDLNILYFQQVPPSHPTLPTLLRRSISNASFDLGISSSRNEIVDIEKNALRESKNVVIFDPSKVLCPKNRCASTVNGHSLYSDENHLSPYGSLYLSFEVQKLIQRILNIKTQN